MKFISIIILFIFFSGCSFDDKSGIWNNENVISDKNKDLKEFRTLSSTDEIFTETISYKKENNIKILNIKKNLNWPETFYNQSNNLINFSYSENNIQILKSKKITRNPISNYLLSNNNNLFFTDIKGNIFVFSINENRLLKKFNFYKKKFKNSKKNLNLIIQNDVIYVSDNFGYLYSYDYIKDKVIWAKNYKVPFRSNLKIKKNKLIAANQNNTLYFFNKNNGDVLGYIPTEDTVLKNEFKNNISLNNINTFFLNTYGSLYSVNNDLMRVNWFLNFNRSVDVNPIDLFDSNEIIYENDFLVLSSKKNTYVINNNNGNLLYKKTFGSEIKPIISNGYLFSINKSDLLIALNLKNGRIIYSYDINEKIANFLDSKKKKSSISKLDVSK